MTFTPFDDYPIHQTPDPLAHPASGDRNHYDRYFFNGYDADAPWFFGFAMGLYPNRGVIDGAFSVVQAGVQRSVFASGRIPADRTQTRVGPIAVEILEPLRVNRVRIDAAHLGIEAELEWRARTAAVEEPRQTIRDGTTVVLDATRLVQWGTWTGWIETEGGRIDAERAFGTKDRSWGVRPVGEPAGGAPGGGLPGGGLYMLWAPLNWPDRATHLIRFEHPDGNAWYQNAVRVPLDDSPPVEATAVEIALEMRPGTRRSRGARLAYTWRDGARDEIAFEPILDFQMKGIGYFNPEWAHGWWRGEAAAGAQTWKLDECDPLDPTTFHVEQLCRVRTGDHEGVGVLEQLILGPHAPSGLRDFTDGAS